MSKLLNTQDFKTGLIEEITPIRTYEYIPAVKNNVEITDNFPSSFILNDEEMGVSVKNQGSVGACVGCALAIIMEAYYKEEMSEGWNYGYLRDNDSESYGMLLNKALKHAKEKGGLPKKYFDLLVEMPGIKQIVDDLTEFTDIAKKYTISNWVDLTVGGSAKKDLAIKDALTTYRVPLLCVCPKGVFSPSESHCLTLVGWDDEKDIYILKNSWGTNNNKQGTVRIAKNKVKNVYLVFADPIELPFKDVSKNDWFYDSVKECYLSGLMNGKSSDSFEPNAPMTRAEIATVMSRLMKKIDDRIVGIKDLIEWKASLKKLDKSKEIDE